MHVARPKNEDRQTWHTSWEGQMATSGKLIVRYGIRTRVNKRRWRIRSRQTLNHNVNIVPRTGNDWSSTVKHHDNLSTSTIPANQLTGGIAKPEVPPQTFRDLGIHIQVPQPRNIQPTIVSTTSGPNRGYRFLDVINIEFHSYGYINDSLKNSQSAFSQAQDGKVYFTMGSSPTLYTAKQGTYSI